MLEKEYRNIIFLRKPISENNYDFKYEQNFQVVCLHSKHNFPKLFRRSFLNY